MPEIRLDLARGARVVVAPDRASRPHEYRRDGSAAPGPCPFCPGHEHMTTPEVAALRPGGGEPNGPGWTIRVVTNLYPALRPDAPEAAGSRDERPPYARAPGVGRHEVLIDGPEHDLHPADQGKDRLAHVLRFLRDRARDMSRDPNIARVIAFKNHGFLAGASLRHPHHQIVGLPAILSGDSGAAPPARGVRRLDQARFEIEAGERVLATFGPFCVYVPFAARFVGEIAIVPTDGPGSFLAFSDERLRDLAAAVADAAARVRLAFGDPDFNWILPAYDPEPDFCFEVVPRISMVGGFELATSATITSMTPEQAVRRLFGAAPG